MQVPEGSNSELIFCYESRLPYREAPFMSSRIRQFFHVTEVDCESQGLLEACLQVSLV